MGDVADPQPQNGKPAKVLERNVPLNHLQPQVEVRKENKTERSGTMHSSLISSSLPRAVQSPAKGTSVCREVVILEDEEDEEQKEGGEYSQSQLLLKEQLEEQLEQCRNESPTTSSLSHVSSTSSLTSNSSSSSGSSSGSNNSSNSQQNRAGANRNNGSPSPLAITFNELASLFTVSEIEASKKLGISKSKLKRVKKRLNIQRWPYRRLQAIYKETAGVEDLIKSTREGSDVEDAETVCAALQERADSLRSTCQFIIKNPNLICKYDNNTIMDIRRILTKVQVSNLLNPAEESQADTNLSGIIEWATEIFKRSNSAKQHQRHYSTNSRSNSSTHTNFQSQFHNNHQHFILQPVHQAVTIRQQKADEQQQSSTTDKDDSKTSNYYSRQHQFHYYNHDQQKITKPVTNNSRPKTNTGKGSVTSKGNSNSNRRND